MNRDPEELAAPLIVPDRGDIEPPRPKREYGKWPWALVGFLIGAATTGLILSGGGSVASETEPTTSTTSGEINNPGIGEQILGFPDTVNAIVAPGDGRAYELITWPNRGEQIRRSIPLSDLTSRRVGFDASGQFLAGLVPSDDGHLLLSGRPNTVNVLAWGVTGFAWHDTDPADLAWSSIDGDEFQIWVSIDARRPTLVTRGIGIEGELSAFGDWGFAITSTSDGEPFSVTTRILDPSGVFVRTIDGFVLDSYAGGKFLVQDASGGLTLVDSNQSIGIDAEGLSEEVVTAAAFSPDGNAVAMLGFLTVKVVAIPDNVEILVEPVRSAANLLDWSSDGEFLAVPGFINSQIIKVDTGETFTILEGETVRAFANVSIPES